MNTVVTALCLGAKSSETFAGSRRKTLARVALAALLLLTQSACSVFQPVADLFGDDDVEGPTELQDFEQELRLNRLWSVGVGDGQGRYYNQLTPAIDREFIFAAGADGTVVAVNRVDGDVLWRNRTDESISGGVGAAFGMVLFVMAQISGMKFEEVVKATLPVLIPLFVVLVLITIFPSLVTGLPDLIMGAAK